MIKLNSYRKTDIAKILSLKKKNFLDVLLIGGTGVGKSSTLNALFGKKQVKVGYGTDPETKKISSYKMDNRMILWDSPGFGDSPQKDKGYEQRIQSVLSPYYHNGEKKKYEIDIILLVIDSSTRDLGSALTILSLPEVKKYAKNKRLMIGLNQADFALKGQGWNDTTKKPSVKLKAALSEKEKSVIKRIKESTDLKINREDVVSYSAKNNYQLTDLMDALINRMKTVNPLKKTKARVLRKGEDMTPEENQAEFIRLVGKFQAGLEKATPEERKLFADSVEKSAKGFGVELLSPQEQRDIRKKSFGWGAVAASLIGAFGVGVVIKDANRRGWF